MLTANIGFHQGEALTSNLIDEYLETAFTLNTIRVLDRMQRPLGINVKIRKIISIIEGYEKDAVYSKIIEDNNLENEYLDLIYDINQINNSNSSSNEKKKRITQLEDIFNQKCRRILEESFPEGSDQDEVIDIVGVKEKISEISKRAEEIKNSNLSLEEKKEQLGDLDRQMQALLIPIANKVARLFPHVSSTNLSDVLEKEDAVCAGKVNVLLSVSKYLGLNARAIGVITEQFGSTALHVCYECNLPSGAKLVIDANSDIYRGDMPNKTDEELAMIFRQSNSKISNPEIQSKIKEYRLSKSNNALVPVDSRVLMYITEDTGRVVTNELEIEEIRNTPYFFVKTDPYTGKKEVHKANIPHPHFITYPDKNGYLYINSSFTFNNRNSSKNVASYLFQMQMRLNPYYPFTTHFIDFLPEGELELMFKDVLQTNPNLYWGGLSVEHARWYIKQGNLEQGINLFEITKTNNPDMYYSKLHIISGCLIEISYGKSQEEKGILKETALKLMQNALDENPLALFTNEKNFNMLVNLYRFEGHLDKLTEVYEQLKDKNEKLFWKTSGIPIHIQVLLDTYLDQAKNNPAYILKLNEYMEEIKTKAPYFYISNIHNIIYNLFIIGPNIDLNRAEEMFGAEMINAGKEFFNEPKNVSTLLRLYLMRHKLHEMSSLLIQFKNQIPELFWDPNNNWCYQLIQMFEDNNQIQEAITLCSEAQYKDTNFYTPVYMYGYLRLVSLYAQNNQLTESTNIVRIAIERDPNFWKNIFYLTGYLVNNPRYRFAEAIKVLETAKDEDPNYWKTDYYIICEYYEKNNEPEKSEQTRKELINIYEGLKTSDLESYYTIIENLAKLYIKEKQTEKAIEVLEDGKNNTKSFTTESLLTLADLYAQTGNLSQARLNYLLVIDLYKQLSRTWGINEVVSRAKARGIDITIT